MTVALPPMTRDVSARTSPTTVRALVLTECVLGGVRHAPGTWCEVPEDRLADLSALGYVLPDAWLDRLRPSAAAAWRAAARRRTVTDASLVVDQATIDDLWASDGRILSPNGVSTTYTPAPQRPGALRVLHLTQYDPGASVYRYHSAANTSPAIVSAFVRFGDSNPHCWLRQWDGELHRRTVDLLAMTADVIHVHMDYRALWHDLRYALAAHQRVAITYHGSVLPGDTGRVLVDDATDRRVGAIRFGARPYHARFGVERYLPIPVPVDDYAALAASRPRWDGPRCGRPLRVAHSPTRRAIKGSTDLEAVVLALREQEGLPVELVLIEHMEHGAALARKATCDVTFDSFWLGMQGSGLEGAAMGQAVIAGDVEAAAEAAALNAGRVPWTFAPDRDALRDVLRALIVKPSYYAEEAARVGAYVRRLHDYRAVGARYSTLLHEALADAARDR